MSDNVSFIELLAPDIQVLAPVYEVPANGTYFKQIFHDGGQGFVYSGPQYVPYSPTVTTVYTGYGQLDMLLGMAAKGLFCAFMILGIAVFIGLIYRLAFGFPNDSDNGLPRWVLRQKMQQRQQTTSKTASSKMKSSDEEPHVEPSFDNQSLHAF